MLVRHDAQLGGLLILWKARNVSPITWRNKPEAKNLRVIKACISIEIAW